MLSYIITIHPLIVLIAANLKCSNELLVPKYHLMEKCHRSKLAAIARANYTSLTSCQKLAIEKKALAFNFSPREAINITHGPMKYTCEVLKCAEVSEGMSLVNDTRFDYYSIYANPIRCSGHCIFHYNCVFHTTISSADKNATCVPTTGMFHLLKRKLNYTQAEAACRNMSGVLAEVTSELRTDTLAQFVAAAKLEAAFVGMRRHDTTQYINTNGDSLECTKYRAWAPGHPRRNYKRHDCAVITRQRTWRSTSCKQHYSALCELMPGGPYKRGSIFPKALTKDKDINSNMTTIKNEE